jgi:hypothetical protein
VIWLCRQLREQGFVPGVISRGYGGDASRVVEINAQMSPDDIGDEPLLILQRAGVPLVVGRNRVSAARALLTAHPEVNVIISDDGLQHYALGRDIEILLFDERGIGNGWLLPAGPLREPVTRRFDFRVLKYWHAKYPAVRLAALVENLNTIDENIKALGFTPAIYSPDYKLLSKSEIKHCHELGMKVIPWTVNDKTEMLELKTWEVDGFITDYPNRAKEYKMTLNIQVPKK